MMAAAERRKPQTVISDQPLDSDKQFLERTNVSAVIRDVLGKVIANRPEDPVLFIADYFDALVEEQTSVVQRALHIITMTHHSRPLFEMNVRDSYDLLSNSTGESKKQKGVNGGIYTELLHELSKSLPSTVTIKLLRKLECYDYEAVPYDVYFSSVFTCCVLREFASIAEQLFGSLDIQKTGKADMALCDAVIDQLKTALGSSRNDVKRIIESSYSLAPEGLHQALERHDPKVMHFHGVISCPLFSLNALSRQQAQGVCTADQFVTDACETFLVKVKKLK